MTAPGPAPPEPAAAPIPIRAALWALFGLLAGALVGEILAGGAVAFGATATGDVATLCGELGLWGGMAGAAIAVSRRFGTGSLRRDLGFSVGRRDAWPGVGAVAVALVVANILGVAFVNTRFHGSNTQLLSGQKHSGVGFAVITVIVAVGAPLFEELFFRGVLRNALRTRLGSTGAVWVQAGLFGLAHYQPSIGLGNVSVMVVVASLGVVLGYTAQITRRLGPGIVAHGLFNAVQVVLVLTS